MLSACLVLACGVVELDRIGVVLAFLLPDLNECFGWAGDLEFGVFERVLLLQIVSVLSISGIVEMDALVMILFHRCLSVIRYSDNDVM